MKKIVILVVLIGTLIMPATAAERPAPAQLAAFFEAVVFGSEYGGAGEGSKVIKKWTGPIRVGLQSMGGKMIDKPGGGRELKLEKLKPTAAQVGFIRKHLRTLLKITGVKAENAKKVSKKPNFHIKFVPRIAMHAPFLVRGADPKLLRRLAAPGVCYFLSAAKDGKIVWATIIVNNQLDERSMEACLL
ncbi:MAG: DUF2927 domain-containing protein [Rhodospirillaceae bacterium]|nr:DUF2927 domain-containing protein [Rhodospirillaceae bacterium]MBT5296779.1 DUF2927 domain-containing protein [Rhodospirillaceae bacterium]MBT5515157.1 DUF2927 domain-containing protein [Rhodospirillaceae bacterium]MBT6087633.1 DUF2927 domain-containing protein [Rhodospirillaceae bacterium]MBT6610250.1 DUF2927 domain-containing protein [Rhodospirillaceae bacterium]